MQQGESVLLRCLYYRGKGGEIREARFLGKRLVWDEPVNIVFFPARTFSCWEGAFGGPMPWWVRVKQTALVKEGPKAMVMYEGGKA